MQNDDTYLVLKVNHKQFLKRCTVKAIQKMYELIIPNFDLCCEGYNIHKFVYFPKQFRVCFLN